MICSIYSCEGGVSAAMISVTSTPQPGIWHLFMRSVTTASLRSLMMAVGSMTDVHTACHSGFSKKQRSFLRRHSVIYDFVRDPGELGH